MIKPEDVEFHRPETADPTWAETNFFGFYNQEAHLNVGVYALFRTNLGIVSSTICMNSAISPTPWQADFCDMRASLPIPAACRLSDFSLANGLRIRCTDPNMARHIMYDDHEGTTIDVHYTSIMQPFDIHDPAMDPMKAAALEQAKAEGGKFAWGTAYNGHFDQTGHFVGRVTVRDRAYPIDCVSTMDHSWGPRPERGAPNMSWLHAHFLKDFAVHAIFNFDPRTNGRDLSLAHGYVVRRGEIFGFQSGTGRTTRTRDRFPDTVELALTDSSGQSWTLHGKGMTTFPWLCWPNMVSFNALAAWTCGDLAGHGEVQDFFELPQLTRLNADPATRTAPAAAC